MEKKGKSQAKPTSSWTASSNIRSNVTVPLPATKPNAIVPSARGTTIKPNTLRVSQDVYNHRKANHLFYRCGEKYSPCHQCKYRQLNCIIGETGEEISEQHDPELELPDFKIMETGEQVMQEAVCLNALSGNNHRVDTILVKGAVKNKHLTVVDSGATHSFIDA